MDVSRHVPRALWRVSHQSYSQGHDMTVEAARRLPLIGRTGGSVSTSLYFPPIGRTGGSVSMSLYLSHIGRTGGSVSTSLHPPAPTQRTGGLVSMSLHLPVSQNPGQCGVNTGGLVAKSCPTLCDSMDCSPPGSSVLGILQAGILERVAISFSRV